ncbi:MAG: LysM peptidoglycan-binding domain-containing protein [Pontiellaceae bacterium]|nr:LysM peptidoglycan-binding domain-containing protein [Pontiellaceae bacterium]MBN2784670.1 LysM peptidoglycan-binding domain-containing protein [Pontiellaceae bacterium]
MKKYIWLPCMTAVVLLSGCETLQTPQQRQQQAQAYRQLEARATEERFYKLQGQLNSIEMENGRLAQEVQQLREELRKSGSSLSQLNSKLQSVEQKHTQDIQEVIRRVESLINQAVATRPTTTSGRGPGREHVVQKGHTLSVIAQAYGTTVDKIKKANNLTSDTIRVGQTLFIPE